MIGAQVCIGYITNVHIMLSISVRVETKRKVVKANTYTEHKQDSFGEDI